MNNEIKKSLLKIIFKSNEYISSDVVHELVFNKSIKKLTKIIKTGAKNIQKTTAFADDLYSSPSEYIQQLIKSVNKIDLLYKSHPTKFIDLGCGVGLPLLILSNNRNYTAEYVGYDINPAKIKIAKSGAKNLGIKNVDFQLQNLQEQPLKLPDDRILIVYMYAPFNFETTEKVLKQLKNHKLGGFLINTYSLCCWSSSIKNKQLLKGFRLISSKKQQNCCSIYTFGPMRYTLLS